MVPFYFFIIFYYVFGIVCVCVCVFSHFPLEKSSPSLL